MRSQKLRMLWAWITVIVVLAIVRSPITVALALRGFEAHEFRTALVEPVSPTWVVVFLVTAVVVIFELDEPRHLTLWRILLELMNLVVNGSLVYKAFLDHPKLNGAEKATIALGLLGLQICISFIAHRATTVSQKLAERWRMPDNRAHPGSPGGIGSARGSRDGRPSRRPAGRETSRTHHGSTTRSTASGDRSSPGHQ